MKVFIDANLLIYLNTMKTVVWRRFIEDFYLNLLSSFKGCTDALVLDEAIYISYKKHKVPYRVTLEFIDSVVLPFVEVLPLSEREYEKAAEILRVLDIKPSDALHAAAMTLNNVSRIASEDKEFEKVRGITRIWLP